MKHIVDNLPRWALTAMTIGEFPKPQMVNGGVMDVINIVKVEIERFKTITTIKNVSHTTIGNGGNGGMGMTSPSTVGDVGSPGQWLANIAAGGNGGDDGGDESGETGQEEVDNRGGGREDRNREFTLVNPRNISIPVFIGKNLNVTPLSTF